MQISALRWQQQGLREQCGVVRWGWVLPQTVVGMEQGTALSCLRVWVLGCCESRSWKGLTTIVESNLGYSIWFYEGCFWHIDSHWKFSLNRDVPLIMRSVLEYILIGESVLPAPRALLETSKNIWSWGTKPAKPPFTFVILQLFLPGVMKLHPQWFLMPVVVRDGDLKSL